MLTEYDVQKLSDEMRTELNLGPAAVWRCAAGLLVVIGLVVIGPAFAPPLDRPSDAAQAQEQRQASLARNDDDGDEQRGVRLETQSHTEAVSKLIPAARVSLQTIK